MLLGDDGHWTEEENEIKNFSKDFFEHLFAEEVVSRGFIQTTSSFPILDHASLKSLARPLLGDEITHAIFDMDPSKSPGEDDYLTYFPKRTRTSWVGIRWITSLMFGVNSIPFIM